MPKTNNRPPFGPTARLVIAYAQSVIDESVGEDEVVPLLLVAIFDAESGQEICHLGRAFLARHDKLADAPYRIGAERCDPRLTKLAAKLYRHAPGHGMPEIAA